MEFPFSINRLFQREITVLDNRLMLYVQKCHRGQSSGEAYKQLCSTIDKLGEGSAKAQGLGATITTARKLEFSDHRLYVMKDPDKNDGNGAVVGILKVGPKRLFVYNSHGNQLEVDAQCVLDFYVHESCQRTGCGKKLFEFMLETEKIKAQHLAIDRPSHKFSGFLVKHYNLKNPIPQLNNFAVFDGFFKDRPGSSAPQRGKTKLHLYKSPNPSAVLHHPAIEALWNAPDGRQSSLSNSNVPLTDFEKEKSILKDVQVPRSDSQDNIAALGNGPLQRSSSLNHDFGTLALDERRGFAAQGSRYSRYEMTAAPPRAESGQKPASATNLGQGQNQGHHLGQQGLSSTPMNAGLNLGQGQSSIQLGQGQGQRTIPGAAQNSSPLAQTKASSPPPLRRDGPSQDYLSMNAHRDYQSTRQGHLRVTPGATAPMSTLQPNRLGSGGDSRKLPLGGALGHIPVKTAENTPKSNDFKDDFSWTPNRTSSSGKKYEKTRLW